MKPVLGIGAATWDHLMAVDTFAGGESVQQAMASVFSGGGPVATALCVMAAQGVPACLLDAQGDDAMGVAIRAELERFRVNVSLVNIHSGASSAHAVVLVRAADGARQITFMPATVPEPGPEAVPLNMGAYSLLHLNGRHENAARVAMQRAQSAGVPVSFDGGAGRWRESLRDLVEGSAIKILAWEFAQRCTGVQDLQAAGRALLAQPGTQVVVITDGVRGSHLWGRGGEAFHQQAFPARPLVDTTGCGDVYHGAFLAAWLKGLALAECARCASLLAARTAEGLGGRWALQWAAQAEGAE